MLRLFSLVVLAVVLTGCGQPEPKAYRVTGTISWKGVPIPLGQVNFVAIDGQTQPATSKIKDGQFELRITPGVKQIHIYSQRSKGFDKVMNQETWENTIPAEYNAKTSLTFEVLPNDDNVYEVALPQKK
ncbi:MAG: hypothetical protein K8U57_01180 [Planctomycetes bacterium]|nr:hypothetical protein [Planctomycetota bacterium]